jgi:hypothetical protein
MDTKTYELAQAKVVNADPNATVNFPESTILPIPISQNEVLTQTSITNYYIGGSLFKNTGLTGVSPQLIIHNSVQKTLINNFISSFTYNADGTKSIEYQSQGNYDDLEVINIQWNVERGEKLFIAQGGHFNKTTDSGADVTYNGRFSTDIAAETSPRVESGVRCGVMINEEE